MYHWHNRRKFRNRSDLSRCMLRDRRGRHVLASHAEPKATPTDRLCILHFIRTMSPCRRFYVGKAWGVRVGGTISPSPSTGGRRRSSTSNYEKKKTDVRVSQMVENQKTRPAKYFHFKHLSNRQPETKSTRKYDIPRALGSRCEQPTDQPAPAQEGSVVSFSFVLFL